MAHLCEKRVWCWWFVFGAMSILFWLWFAPKWWLWASFWLFRQLRCLFRCDNKFVCFGFCSCSFFLPALAGTSCRMLLLWFDGFSCRFDGFLWLLQMLWLLMSCWWQDKWFGFWFLLWLQILLLSRHTRSNSHLSKVLAMISQNESRMSWKQADWKSALE